MSRSLFFVVPVALAACTPRQATTPVREPVTVPAIERTAAEEGSAEKEPQTPPTGTEEQVFDMEGIRIQVEINDEGESEVVATDARSLLDEGNDALARGEGEEALAAYARLLNDFPDSSLVPAALFNSGLAHEGMEQFDDALRRFDELAQKDPSSEEAREAMLRAAAVTAELERWDDGLVFLDTLLSQRELPPAVELEALARKGYVLIESADFPAAATSLRKAVELVANKEARDELARSDYFAAMAHFYLADIPRRQFEAIPIRLPKSQMERDLEAKAGLVIEASDGFGLTVKQGNIYWATAAGFRLATMQRDFWRALIAAPIPAHLDELEREAYVEEVHRQAQGFLTKAISIHERNLTLSSVYKMPTIWSDASKEEHAQLTVLLGRELAGDLVAVEEVAQWIDSVSADEGQYIPARAEL